MMNGDNHDESGEQRAGSLPDTSGEEWVRPAPRQPSHQHPDWDRWSDAVRDAYVRANRAEGLRDAALARLRDADLAIEFAEHQGGLASPELVERAAAARENLEQLRAAFHVADAASEAADEAFYEAQRAWQRTRHYNPEIGGYDD